jgi:flavodoxin
MNSLVIYASRTGNTRKVADAIAEALRTRGAVQLLAADEVPASLPDDTDLVVIGGPTERHAMTEPVTKLFERFAPGVLRDVAAAAFGTRLRWPRRLSGSAAADITRQLRVSGARVIAPDESFMVSMKPLLEAGELQRASAWAVALADIVERRPAVGSTADAG